ncbi:hypothetical protein [Actinomadura gamaensis]|uniref:Uncharacterized protein n=1 Tax=Actinomadura gamaensis TaxID=1763541 RepID=A0ABV9TR68_9ACTN
MSRPTPQRIGLNWRHDPVHWGGGHLLPCRLCGRGAFCRDQDGRPCHKTCLEDLLTAERDIAEQRERAA